MRPAHPGQLLRDEVAVDIVFGEVLEVVYPGSVDVLRSAGPVSKACPIDNHADARTHTP